MGEGVGTMLEARAVDFALPLPLLRDRAIKFNTSEVQHRKVQKNYS